MSVLAIQLPPRERLGARATGHESAAAVRLPIEWPFVFSTDGRSVAQSGHTAAALLPRADHTVLVLAEPDVSWHRVAVPKAPPARLRAALLGVMEEALLDDDETLHFALAPGTVPGQTGWVAVTHRPRLVAALAALETAGVSVERVAPSSVPIERARAATDDGEAGDTIADMAADAADDTGAGSRGHFFSDGLAEAGEVQAMPWLALASASGAVCLRLSGALARALVPDTGVVRWTATPAAAGAAEQWLGQPVLLMTEAERALESAANGANLRQFDLAPHHRGTRALREGAKRFFSAEWRPVRLGLAALVLLQVIGMNAYAWQLRREITDRRAALGDLLKASHPGVRAVLDAPLQMERETERLRAAAGRPGDGDLESLLGAAAAAWPDGQGPVQTLRFESGALTLAAGGWGEPQITQFRQRLNGTGFVAELADGRITVTRSVRPSGAA